jgi:hypothetical protein
MCKCQAAVPPFTVSLELAPAFTAAGLIEVLAPLGTPETARLTVPAVPTTVVEMVLDPLVPCIRLKLPGLAEIVKSGFAFTLSVTVVE